MMIFSFGPEIEAVHAPCAGGRPHATLSARATLNPPCTAPCVHQIKSHSTLSPRAHSHRPK
eukprot:59952-Prymnesium_polylepis.1